MIGWGYYIRDTYVDYTPVILPRGYISSRTISKIASGSGTQYVLTSDNNLFAWGHNLYGSLGDGTTTSTGCMSILIVLTNRSFSS
jgi:alpha-tubulin suppressor-like RCC1 family protein